MDTSTPSKTEIKDEMGRLEKVFISMNIMCNAHAFGLTESCKLVKKYERGDLQKCDWLDKLAFRRMEEIHAVSLFFALECATGYKLIFYKAEANKSDNFFLYIDLPRFDFPIVFSEPVSFSFEILPIYCF